MISPAYVSACLWCFAMTDLSLQDDCFICIMCLMFIIILFIIIILFYLLLSLYQESQRLYIILYFFYEVSKRLLSNMMTFNDITTFQLILIYCVIYQLFFYVIYFNFSLFLSLTKLLIFSFIIVRGFF